MKCSLKTEWETNKNMITIILTADLVNKEKCDQCGKLFKLGDRVDVLEENNERYITHLDCNIN